MRNGNPVRETREYPTAASINLSARHFFGGAKALSELQTEFHRKVGIPSGLERGMEGSKATHQRVSQFYGNITRGEPDNIEFPKERLVVKKGFIRGMDMVEPDGDLPSAWPGRSRSRWPPSSTWPLWRPRRTENARRRRRLPPSSENALSRS